MQVKEFVDNYLNIDNQGGAAASDPRYEVEQVDDKSYVPNAAQLDRMVQRLYSYFGVNEKIVQNKFMEDEWTSFFEAEIEPIIIALSSAFTQAFFTAREKGFGNQIVFEASHLAYLSMKTKLQLVQFVDRGMLTPNEVRNIMNLQPITGGDKPIRRLDTVQVGSVDDDIEKGDDDSDDET
jgi:hypothetical protein